MKELIIAFGLFLFIEGILYAIFPSRFCESDAAVLNKHTGQRIALFTPRDLRRTAKQIMQRAGVDVALRDLLQDHNQGGVANKHYANNPEAALPDKWRAINAYNEQLKRIIGEN